jgi:transglutaminase-like putative cysteine protease
MEAATDVPNIEYLAPTYFLDFGSEAVRAFAADTVAGAQDDGERAVRLYYAVRDAIRYDPYRMGIRPEAYRASSVLREKAAYCIPKANLLAAAARAVGIPAAIGLADVRNHLTTAKLRALMGTDEFLDHGYTTLWLGGRWVKCTPAFNIELCTRFGVLPLEFDGEHDSLMHPYDAKNQRHMEYLRDHGRFAEFPFERVMADFKRAYPNLMRLAGAQGVGGAFEQEQPILP